MSTDDAPALGSRLTSVGSVSDAWAAVDLPEAAADGADLDVTAYAYDDAEGQVELSIGSGVSIKIALDAAEARELAQVLALAAEEAEADVPVDE